jgi:hypothetical protein
MASLRWGQVRGGDRLGELQAPGVRGGGVDRPCGLQALRVGG